VISVPCMELFAEQSPEYQDAIIGNAPVRLAIEAGIREGWDHLIGSDGLFVGMKGFGASGEIGDLYKHFGITAEDAAAAVKNRLQKTA
jgi:transketolase